MYYTIHKMVIHMISSTPPAAGMRGTLQTVENHFLIGIVIIK